MRRCLCIFAVLSALPLAALAPVPAAAQAGPIRFAPSSPDAWVRVDARFRPNPDVCPGRQPQNLHAAYGGVLEIGRRSNGQLYLVTELTFPEYLNGIAEVPGDWPMEALKAQVVAARTYAISHMNPSTAVARELRYNLCATDACQVYRGLNVSKGPGGAAWTQAVAATSGEVLEYQGKAARTYYFSTSNGRTYSNQEIFSTAPLPYLKSVKESDDVQSPLSNWSVRMPLADLTESLRLAKFWTGGPIERVVQRNETVTVSGAGQSRSLPMADLRTKLNAQAVCLVPKRYPTNAPNGRPYPQTVPSEWATVRQEGDQVVINGRGWGHGVGMVQWGLKGKAERGMSYRDMLAYYYGGLRPVKRPEPDKIRVGLAVNLEEVTIERNGNVMVSGAALPDGPVRVTGGPALGFAPSDPIPERLRMEKLVVTPPPGPAGPATINFELSAPALVHLEYSGPAGVRGVTPEEPRDRGLQSYSWDPAAAGLGPGRYEVTVVAADGVDRVRSQALEIGLPSPSPTPTRQRASPSPTAAVRAAASRPPLWLWPLAGAGLFLVAAAAAIYLIRRRVSR
jgi:SpoIID/LytB domain protein